MSLVAPNSTPPRLVNSQLVSLPPVGILNLLCLIIICVIFVMRIWSYSYGICAIKMLIIIIKFWPLVHYYFNWSFGFGCAIIIFIEMWQVDEVTTAADWWSVGALLYEIITGQVWSNVACTCISRLVNFMNLLLIIVHWKKLLTTVIFLLSLLHLRFDSNISTVLECRSLQVN